MEYRRLGRTGVEVSAFSLGAMNFGSWATTDRAACLAVVGRALDAGINLVDTADAYSEGESERIVGEAIRSRRDEVILATKFHLPMGPRRDQRGNSARWVRRAVEASLRRLGTDHIELYQVHRPDLFTDLDDTLGALTDLVHAGKIGYLGCSTFPSWHLVEGQWTSERRNHARFVVEQPPYSMLVRHGEEALLPVAQRYDMGAIVWGPLAGGWLTGKYRRDDPRPTDSRATRTRGRLTKLFDPTRPEVQAKLDAVERLEVVAAAAGVTLTHLANAFVLAHPAVTSAIVGPRDVRQLEELLVGESLRLGDDVLDAIDEIVPPGHTIDPHDRGWRSPFLGVEHRRRGRGGRSGGDGAG